MLSKGSLAYAGSSSGAGESKGQDGTLECSICLDTAMEATISLGGLLFSWPCLHQWLETKPNRQVCPIGKAGLSNNKVILFHSRGSPGAVLSYFLLLLLRRDARNCCPVKIIITAARAGVES
uniref:E3 ubiquitin-protein ligase RNF n=1 Tax=Bos indicus x Bos taurus TaxID=30522 RepID=A0A4W2CG00_BOBOX